jgi:hypothetical protein
MLVDEEKEKYDCDPQNINHGLGQSSDLDSNISLDRIFSL